MCVGAPLIPTVETPLVEVRCGGRSSHLVTHSNFYVCVIKKIDERSGACARTKCISDQETRYQMEPADRPCERRGEKKRNAL